MVNSFVGWLVGWLILSCGKPPRSSSTSRHPLGSKDDDLRELRVPCSWSCKLAETTSIGRHSSSHLKHVQTPKNGTPGLMSSARMHQVDPGSTINHQNEVVHLCWLYCQFGTPSCGPRSCNFPQRQHSSQLLSLGKVALAEHSAKHQDGKGSHAALQCELMALSMLGSHDEIGGFGAVWGATFCDLLSF